MKFWMSSKNKSLNMVSFFALLKMEILQKSLKNDTLVYILLR
jgi:hypothetical protein